MSPLAKLLIVILRIGCMGCAGLVGLCALILLWQKHTPEGFVLSRQDYGVLGVFAGLVAFALILMWAITREIRAHSAPPPGT